MSDGCLVGVGLLLLSVVIDIVFCSLYGPDSTDGADAFSFIMVVFQLFLKFPLLYFLSRVMGSRSLSLSPFVLASIEGEEEVEGVERYSEMDDVTNSPMGEDQEENLPLKG